MVDNLESTNKKKNKIKIFRNVITEKSTGLLGQSACNIYIICTLLMQ